MREGSLSRKRMLFSLSARTGLVPITEKKDEGKSLRDERYSSPVKDTRWSGSIA
jgi:hypothetical protein